MTLKARNIIILVFFVLLCLAIAGFVFLVLSVDFANANLGSEYSKAMGQYLDLEWSIEPSVLIINVTNAGASVVLAWIACFIFLRDFRRVISPQLFFLVLFWLSMGFEIIRIINIYAIVSHESIGTRMALSRLEMAARVFGSLSILSASLYASGIKIKNQGYLLASISIISLAVAYLLPLDVTRLNQTLLYSVSGALNTDSFRIIAGILSIVNFLKSALSSRDINDYVTLVPIVLLLGGYELAYASTDWLVLSLAWTCLTVSMVWLTRRFMSSFMWY